MPDPSPPGPVGPVPSSSMDRRGFLTAGTVAMAAACASPQRELLDDYAGTDLELSPGGERTTTVPPENDVDSTTAPEPDLDGSPFEIPADDIPGLSFVAEAIRPSVTAYADIVVCLCVGVE